METPECPLLDEFGRPNWTSWFMSLALLTSSRSIDPSTKHGACITTPDNSIVSLGYNGPPRGAIDKDVPLTRPAKYHILAHAEANSLDNCNVSVHGYTIYITGKPCHQCLLRLVQRGIKKIVYGNIGSHMLDEAEEKKCQLIIDVLKPERRPEIVHYNRDDFLQIFHIVEDYYRVKNGQK